MPGPCASGSAGFALVSTACDHMGSAVVQCSALWSQRCVISHLKSASPPGIAELTFCTEVLGEEHEFIAFNETVCSEMK